MPVAKTTAYYKKP